MSSQAKQIWNHCFKVDLFFTAPPAVWVHMCIIGSVISDDCRVLSVLLLQQSGLLWLILTATVAKHSAPRQQQMYWLCSVELGQPTVDSKHCCVLKVSERPQTAFLKSHVSNDVTSLPWTTGVAVVTQWMIPRVSKCSVFSEQMGVRCVVVRE